MTAPILGIEKAIVVVPAHNERTHLPRCLRAITTAAACVAVPVVTVVVLDSCDDDSAALAGQYGPDVHFVTVDARNVGGSRAAGFSYADGMSDEFCAGVDASQIWYATTDADSRVDPDWLARQIDADADMVLGVVRVEDWRNYPASVIRRYLRTYNRNSGESHRHIHGANMGFRADAYWEVGGFRALASGEDVELVQRFEAAGLDIRRDPKLSVVTSARPAGRAPGGFASHLRRVSKSVRPVVQDSA